MFSISIVTEEGSGSAAGRGAAAEPRGPARRPSQSQVRLRTFVVAARTVRPRRRPRSPRVRPQLLPALPLRRRRPRRDAPPARHRGVAQILLKRQPDLKGALFHRAERFVNQLINSLRFKSMHSFRERYRSIDVLLVDDIQFLANKERTQEFFRTFNALASQRQIILSSDCSPRSIPAIEERLRSRFEWGLIADIQAPDLETKVAILRRKADQDGVQLPDDVALFVAHQVKSNVRELEGMLNRVAAFSSLTGKPLSLELTKETLRVSHPSRRRPSRDRRRDHQVRGRNYGLGERDQVQSDSKQIAFPRQVAMFLCKERQTSPIRRSGASSTTSTTRP
ncbi:MAG: DnaA/Hda family protein [Thermoanaerobaculia bacterium]